MKKEFKKQMRLADSLTSLEEKWNEIKNNIEYIDEYDIEEINDYLSEIKSIIDTEEFYL